MTKSKEEIELEYARILSDNRGVEDKIRTEIAELEARVEVCKFQLTERLQKETEAGTENISTLAVDFEEMSKLRACRFLLREAQERLDARKHKNYITMEEYCKQVAHREYLQKQEQEQLGSDFEDVELTAKVSWFRGLFGKSKQK